MSATTATYELSLAQGRRASNAQDLKLDRSWLHEQARAFREGTTERGVLFDGATPVPTSLTPRLIERERYARLARDCECVLDAIERVLRAYVTLPEIQERFPELAAMRALSLRIPPYERWVQNARFDLVETPTGDFRLMETNCDCPGAVMWTPLIRQAHQELEYFREYVLPLGPQPQPVDDPRSFINSLIEVFQRTRATARVPSIAFVSSLYRPILTDMDLFEQQAHAIGVDGRHVRVQSLLGGAGGVRQGATTFDVVYQKFDAFIDDDGQFRFCVHEHSEEEARAFWDGLASDAFLCFNSHPSITVAENKRTLSLLFDNEVRSLLTRSQCEAVDRLCLPTYPLSRRTAEDRERLWDVLGRRERYVLKRIIDTRGRGVTIGAFTRNDQWRSLVESAVDGPYIVQDYAPHPPSRIVAPHAGDREIDVFANVGMFLYAGRAQGLLCRASLDPVTNVARSGAIQPVYVVDRAP